MIQLQLKIPPEAELFNHLHDSQEIRSYCSGENGLLIYSSTNSVEKNTFPVDFHNATNNKIKKVTATGNEHFVSFACNCLNEPPTKLRKIIQNLGGFILDPIRVKHNWEYLEIVFNNNEILQDFQKELHKAYYTDFEILSL